MHRTIRVTPALVGVVHINFDLSQTHHHTNTRASTHLHHELTNTRSLTGRTMRRTILSETRPRTRISPRHQTRRFRLTQRHHTTQLRHLRLRQRTSNHQTRALDKTTCLLTLRLSSQRIQVTHRVRNHRLAHTITTIQTSQRVNTVHHVRARTQRTPKLIEDHEIVTTRRQPLIRQRVRNFHRRERRGPARQQSSSLHVTVNIRNLANVEHRRAVHRQTCRGRLREHIAKAALTI